MRGPTQDGPLLVKYWVVLTPVTSAALTPVITVCHSKCLPLKCRHPQNAARGGRPFPLLPPLALKYVCGRSSARDPAGQLTMLSQAP